MRGLYVRALRAARALLAVTGALRVLDRLAPRSRTALWVRSWFAIYDLGDLMRLDVPWWTFEASDEVAWFLGRRSGARAFEWGSGASTAWLSRRCEDVVTIEHDADWATRVRPVLPRSASLRLVEPTRGPARPVVASAKRGFGGLDFGPYVAAIDDVPGAFDLIVIDGRAREACLDRAVERLAVGGLIVLDNVERARYRDAVARHGTRLSVTWTRGRTPALPYPTRTALISVRST